MSAKLELSRLNSSISCALCNGYLVDATKVTACLHTFCRSCIWGHLQKCLNECGCKSASQCRCCHCPLAGCGMYISSSKPYKSLRSDHTLQELIYKLVPNMFSDEMARRRKFYEQHPVNDSLLTEEDRGIIQPDRVFYSPTDRISLSLEYGQGNNQRPISELPGQEPVEATTEQTRRYLLCPATAPISLLKKFLKNKYELPGALYNVEVMYLQDFLEDDLTLADLAYIYHWRRKEPLRLFYRVQALPAKCKSVSATSVTSTNTTSTSNPYDFDKEPTETRKRKLIPESRAQMQISTCPIQSSPSAMPVVSSDNSVKQSSSLKISSSNASNSPMTISTHQVPATTTDTQSARKMRKILPASQNEPNKRFFTSPNVRQQQAQKPRSPRESVLLPMTKMTPAVSFSKTQTNPSSSTVTSLRNVRVPPTEKRARLASDSPVTSRQVTPVPNSSAFASSPSTSTTSYTSNSVTHSPISRSSSTPSPVSILKTQSMTSIPVSRPGYKQSNVVARPNSVSMKLEKSSMSTNKNISNKTVSNARPVNNSFNMSSILEGTVSGGRSKSAVVTINNLTITSSALSSSSSSTSSSVSSTTSFTASSTNSPVTTPTSLHSSITSSSSQNTEIIDVNQSPSNSVTKKQTSPHGTASLSHSKQSPKSPNSFVITGGEDLHSCVTDRGIKIVRSPLSPTSPSPSIPSSSNSSTPLSTSGPTKTSSSDAGGLLLQLKIPKLNGNTDVKSKTPSPNTSNGILGANKPMSSKPDQKIVQKKGASIAQIVNKITSSKLGKPVPVSSTTSGSSLPFSTSSTTSITSSSNGLSGKSNDCVKSLLNTQVNKQVEKDQSISRNDPLVIRIPKASCSKPVFSNNQIEVTIDEDEPMDEQLCPSRKRPHEGNATFTDNEDDDEDEGKLVVVIPEQSDQSNGAFDEQMEASMNQAKHFARLGLSALTCSNTPPSSSPDFALKFSRSNDNNKVASTRHVKPAHQNGTNKQPKSNGNQTGSAAIFGPNMVDGTVSPPQTPSPKPGDSHSNGNSQPHNNSNSNNNFGALDLTTVRKMPISGGLSSLLAEKSTDARTSLALNSKSLLTSGTKRFFS